MTNYKLWLGCKHEKKKRGRDWVDLEAACHPLKKVPSQAFGMDNEYDRSGTEVVRR